MMQIANSAAAYSIIEKSDEIEIAQPTNEYVNKINQENNAAFSRINVSKDGTSEYQINHEYPVNNKKINISKNGTEFHKFNDYPPVTSQNV